MLNLTNFVIVVLLIIPYTCNGQTVYCYSRCPSPDTSTCIWNRSRLQFLCECNEGYWLNSRDCKDTNECSRHNICGPSSAGYCANTIGSYVCRCFSGHTLNINNKCTDIDECTRHNICGSSSAGQCINIEGSYRCQCNTGYTRINGICTDINECLTNNICGPPSAGHCVNTVGSYTCQCNGGYQFINNTCEDIDECLTPDLCGPPSAGSCVNSPKSFRCNCRSGYILDGNGTCADADECEENSTICDNNADCTNFPGGYNCTCTTGFSGDGRNCTAIFAQSTSSVENPGVIAGIVLGGLVGVVIIVLLVIIIITRRRRTKHAREDVPLPNQPIGHQPNYVNIGMSKTSSRQNDARENATMANWAAAEDNVEDLYANEIVKEKTGQISEHGDKVSRDGVRTNREEMHCSIEEMYSNKIVKERRKRQRELEENSLVNATDAVYMNAVPPSRQLGPYDGLWKDSVSQQNPRNIGSPHEETYNHIHHRPLEVPPNVDHVNGADLYNHLYDNGKVSYIRTNESQVTSNDSNEYSVAD